MFSKILIANRGEIACRIIKSAQAMGIKTVAVYSDADADALFVEMADEAVHIGPPPSAESYLVIDKILAAVKETGAEAVHPGYGFLSEREAFADALKEAGVAFIGPNTRAIAAMGDKIESKKLASEAGVSTVPGYLGVITDASEAVSIANDIGYPVMIKASAGGGGKGMRIANSAAEVEEGFISSMNEARSSFGDDRVFIEKFVTQPRHIEIQVLADKHGNTIYLGERECSIQRRNQKVIEEAPSPFLDEATRKAMGEEAVALAKAVDYDSAGTVEFIVDGDRNFYFLEMNTRLQVEHPVTELITGVDLVEQMIRVAAGEKLSISQDDVKLNGWAVESRIYAEDPFRNFLPSIGRLSSYSPPEEGSSDGLTIRNDAGVYEGSEITMFYDPMISKLCTHAPTRAQAIDHMLKALNEFDIKGIEHNIPFLAAVMTHQRFKDGNLTTGFIAEEFPDGFTGMDLPAQGLSEIAAIAVQAQLKFAGRSRVITGRISTTTPLKQEWVVSIGDVDHKVTAREEGELVRIQFEDASIGELTVDSKWVPGESLHRSMINDRPVSALIDKEMDGWRLRTQGASYTVFVRTPRAAELARLMPEKVAPDTSKLLLCPMPGLVVDIPVSVGQEIKAGQTLAIVEAMKMENVLKAERDGVVSKINAEKGDSLAVDEIILEFE